MVSIADGELTRTWNFVAPNQQVHVINLSHDTLTGVRHAMLDYEEIPGSMGSSSLLMDKRGHRFHFSIDGILGYVEITRDGWLGFKYNCVVGGESLPEATSGLSRDQGEEPYVIDIPEFAFTSDWTEGEIAWYEVSVTRRADNVRTSVHRRFRDFAELLTEIKRRLKGHHLYSSLPELPEKHIKFLKDHNDNTFLMQRTRELKHFLVSLFRFPHVPHMTCSKAFLGLMEQVRETSFIFSSQVLGLSLAVSPVPGTSAVIGTIQAPDQCPGLHPGDVISKLNGRAIGGMSHVAIVNTIKSLKRPIIIHFVQALGDVALDSPPARLSPAPSGTEDSDGFRRLQKGKHLPSFSGDKESTLQEYKSLSDGDGGAHSP